MWSTVTFWAWSRHSSRVLFEAFSWNFTAESRLAILCVYHFRVVGLLLELPLLIGRECVAVEGLRLFAIDLGKWPKHVFRTDSIFNPYLLGGSIPVWLLRRHDAWLFHSFRHSKFLSPKVWLSENVIHLCVSELVELVMRSSIYIASLGWAKDVR